LSVESHWEEDLRPPEPIGLDPTPPDPREAPLWDPWIDSPGAR
jgi:hypothetical protein